VLQSVHFCIGLRGRQLETVIKSYRLQTLFDSVQNSYHKRQVGRFLRRDNNMTSWIMTTKASSRPGEVDTCSGIAGNVTNRHDRHWRSKAIFRDSWDDAQRSRIISAGKCCPHAINLWASALACVTTQQVAWCWAAIAVDAHREICLRVGAARCDNTERCCDVTKHRRRRRHGISGCSQRQAVPQFRNIPVTFQLRWLEWWTEELSDKRYVRLLETVSSDTVR